MRAIHSVVPGNHSLLAIAGQIRATMWAEIKMQWRRQGLWVVFGCATGLLVLITVQAAMYLSHLPPDSLYVLQHYTSADLDNLMIDNTTTYSVMFFGLVAALLVVDRVERDQRLSMVELQRATPQGYLRYTLGKYFGNYIAVLVPTFLACLLCALLTTFLGWPVVFLLKFLQAFALVFIPSSLAAVSLALLLASFLPVRIVQIGFSLLWLYFNTGLGRYGFGASIFNPSGQYIYAVFFPVPHMQYVEPDFQTSLQLALLNITVLLLTAVGALCLTYGSLVYQRYREEKA